MSPLPVGKFIDKLKSYYVKEKVPVPMISQQTALLCSAAFTVIFIAPFYLSPTLRSTPLQSRDAPSVIRARVQSVLLTCLLSTAITSYMLVTYGHATAEEIARFLGLWPVIPFDIVKVLGLVMVLFAGPLYETILVNGEWRGWDIFTLKQGLFDDWTGFRNLIVAPTSEEIVFRALTISLYLLAELDPVKIVLTTPLIFGVAHVHHFVEFLQSRTPRGRSVPPLSIWLVGLLRSTFQFGYTALFGFFAAFVFLRTGNLWACIIAHMFCNWQGLPRMYGRVGQFETESMHITPDVAQGKRDEEDAVSAQKYDGPQNLGILWSVVYYALIVVGAYYFYELLWPLTESANALAAL